MEKAGRLCIPSGVLRTNEMAVIKNVNRVLEDDIFKGLYEMLVESLA